MAQIANPRKKFNFGIFTPGLNEFLAQKVGLPEWENEVDEHGDTNYLIKTAGLAKFGMLSIEKISTAVGPDNWIHQWITECQDTVLGGGLLPSQYKRYIIVIQYSVDNLTPINRWNYEGAWPQKINGIDLSRYESGNTIENIEFCIDRPVHG